MPYVRVKENEPFDIALRRFKRSCEKAGVLSEVRRREFYEKPTAVRKRKSSCCRQTAYKEGNERDSEIRQELLKGSPSLPGYLDSGRLAFREIYKIRVTCKT